MAQQMVNGSHYDGSVTYTNRMSNRYAVVSAPESGAHYQKKPNRHGVTQNHVKLSSYAAGLVDLPYNKFAR